MYRNSREHGGWRSPNVVLPHKHVSKAPSHIVVTPKLVTCSLPHLYVLLMSSRLFKVIWPVSTSDLLSPLDSPKHFPGLKKHSREEHTYPQNWKVLQENCYSLTYLNVFVSLIAYVSDEFDQIPTELANFCGEIPGTTFVYLCRQFVSLSLSLMKPQIVCQDHLPQ